jgi:hypothetical protein
MLNFIRSSVRKCCTLALCTVVNFCFGFVVKWTVSLDCRLQVFSRISFPSVSDDPNYVATHFCRNMEIFVLISLILGEIIAGFTSDKVLPY